MPKGKKKGKYDHKRTEVYSSDEDAGIDMGDNYSETSGQSDMKSTHDDAGKTQDPQQNVPTAPCSPLSDDVLYLCTYNIMSLSTEERLVELTYCLKNVKKWDVIGLAEVKRMGEMIVEFDDFILCYVGTVPGLYGVGFLVKKYLVGSIVSFVPVSDRVAVLVLDVKENIISLIQVYAPTEFSNRQDLAIFYRDLNKAMNMCEGHILVMGDLNARIGQCKSTYEFRVVGNHGYGLRSNRGNILLQFCLDNQLKVINTFFTKNPNKKWTRQSLDGRSKCELDYVLCKSTNIFTNIEVIHLKFSSDHRLIRSTIKLGKKKSPKKLLIKNVKQENAPNSETNSIGEFKRMIADYNTRETYQELYDFIEMELIKYTDLLKQINVILPSSVNKYCSPAEISKDSIDLLNIRQKLRNKSERSKEERQQLTTVVKELNSSIENDVTNYKLQYLMDAEETSEALKKINEQKLWITCLKDEYGDKVYKRNYIMEIATNYFRKLYSHRLLDKESSYVNQTASQISDLDHNILEFLHDEIRFSIKNSNKYVCNDDVITKELIVHLEPYLSKPLQKLFNLILKEQKVPRQWLSLTLSVQYKNGDPSLLTSYNTTASIPIIYQIFSNTLVNRISRSIDEMATVEQAYSRNNLTKLDHIYVLSQVIEKYNILKKPLYVAFVNYTEPYNSMFHEAIWTALRDIQVETNYVNLYKYINENMNAKMRLDRVGTEFKVKTGMRQEDPSTAKLFSAVLDYIFRQFDWSNKGININGRFLSYLICKDVVLLISEEGNEMQEMLDSIDNNSRHAGLVIDTSKTKVLTNSSKVNIIVNGNILEYVKDYIYLGHLVSFENNMRKVIDLRLKSAKAKFRGLKFVFESHLNMEFKKSIFASHVLPYLIYGCETWSLRKTDETRLKNCHKTMENSMISSLIANQTGLPDVMHAIRVKKWLWVGEVMRATDNRWSREVMEWYQPKKARSKTWSADLASVAGKTWPRQAQDAYVWKGLEETYLNI